MASFSFLTSYAENIFPLIFPLYNGGTWVLTKVKLLLFSHAKVLPSEGQSSDMRIVILPDQTLGEIWMIQWFLGADFEVP